MNLRDNDKIIYSNPLERTRSTPIPFSTPVPSSLPGSPNSENQSPYPTPINSIKADQPYQTPNPYP